ncbi:hypothetical protein FO519_005046 [Halicephalobus sp. NKZ332]|nr:hypothetical protein FO519_005046 [Halicephalobus sp. NKZ332]
MRAGAGYSIYGILYFPAGDGFGNTPTLPRTRPQSPPDRVTINTAFERLTRQICKFQFNPEIPRGLFSQWWGRYEAQVRGTSVLSEERKRDLVLNSLENEEYLRYSNAIRPQKPESVGLEETITNLAAQFDNTHSVCLNRVNALSTSNPKGLSFERIVERANVKGDEFQIETFTMDAAKLLILIFDLYEDAHKQTRGLILKIMAEKPKATFQEVVASSI